MRHKNFVSSQCKRIRRAFTTPVCLHYGVPSLHKCTTPKMNALCRLGCTVRTSCVVPNNKCSMPYCRIRCTITEMRADCPYLTGKRCTMFTMFKQTTAVVCGYPPPPPPPGRAKVAQPPAVRALSKCQLKHTHFLWPTLAWAQLVAVCVACSGYLKFRLGDVVAVGGGQPGGSPPGRPRLLEQQQVVVASRRRAYTRTPSRAGSCCRSLCVGAGRDRPVRRAADTPREPPTAVHVKLIPAGSHSNAARVKVQSNTTLTDCPTLEMLSNIPETRHVRGSRKRIPESDLTGSGSRIRLDHRFNPHSLPTDPLGS